MPSGHAFTAGVSCPAPGGTNGTLLIRGLGLVGRPLTGREEPAIKGFSLAAAISVAVGVCVGVATTVGITLAVADRSLVQVPSLQRPALTTGPYQVEYGDRCFHGHCLHW